MNKLENRRRFTRVGFDTQADISQGEATFTMRVIDISLNGVLAETPEEYALNAEQPVTICIALTEDDTIIMQARLAHSSSKLLGFQSESIDMTSIAHLRRLIELNLGDPGASERLLEELLANH
ncbi:MAG: hypothetical protein ACI9Y1_000166 [Lentisphaeria bacterium]|jgi:hypothetical protein